MYSVQSYIKRLPTEVLEMLLQNHESGIEKQLDEVIIPVRETLQERKAQAEKHPGSE